MPNQVGGAVLDMVLDLLGMDDLGEFFDGYGDAGVATLVLALENGFTVQHSWKTDISKFRSGIEQRRSRNDMDRESYSGAAFLLNDSPRDVRAMLARYSSAGSVFLLGLPHEALVLRDASSSTTVPVFSSALALCDWAVRGQRVVVAHEDEDGDLEYVNAVVQSATSDTIELDVAIGTLGVVGAGIMPAKAIYLEPQQDFDRGESDVETWNIRARYAKPLDFAPTLASLELTGKLSGLTAIAREFGLVGNTRTIEIIDDVGVGAAGILTQPAGFTQWLFEPDVSTVADFIAALSASSYIRITGTPDTPAATLDSSDNFIDVLAGGTATGAVGTGATIEEYEDFPVWDREIIADGAVADGVQSMTQIIDHDGIPYALGTADQPDWYRAVVLAAGDREDWQWFKLFMSTVRGKQKKFWLATWREDLVYDSHAADEVDIDSDAGDFTAWWPSKRQHVQVLQVDNTVTYAEVLSAVDNGDGTRTLTLSETLSADEIEKISWLEICRFENADDYTTQHGQHGFDVQLTARVVP
jgi:hypothetical protein